MNDYNYRLNTDGIDHCIRCAYYLNRTCQVTESNVNPFGRCDAYLNWRDETTSYLVKRGDSWIIQDAQKDKFIEFASKKDALQSEVNQRMTTNTVHGNKIVVHGRVLPLSEYEDIAQSVIEENT